MLKCDFDAGLARFDILAALERKRAGMTMSELAEALLVTNGNVTGRMQTLLRDGLVEIQKDESDRRVSIASLTPKGIRTFKKMAESHHAWVREIFEPLTNEDQAALYADLGKLREALKSSIG
nr:MarR family transcriptional regulator [Erythrobacter sp. KY5]